MLYVFLVDTGKMMTFDMNHALESVDHLKSVIEAQCDIPADRQVLLISGGESLNPASSVGSYSAGTDTNPIFLFSKQSIESDLPLRTSDHLLAERDMRDHVEGALNLPPSYHTVVTRTQLAQEFYELAKEETIICEHLVHDQHLQQQGWAAVVANLEDTTTAFRNRASLFEQSFTQFLETHSQYSSLLQNFTEDLSLLAKIPILPALFPPGFNSDRRNVPQTLLDWISSKDSQSSLDQVADQCLRGLKQLNQVTLENLKAEIQSTIAAVDNSTMKEIKGLEERLFGLEDLMQKARRLVQDQQELAQAFLQNQSRASHLKDPSIFPDLCSSHIKQLKMMLTNHQQLRDIKRRCVMAKDELSTNLKTRLRWIIYVEKTISEVSNKLVFHHENMKRLKRHLEVVHQIHLAPKVYVGAVVEVVRRRNFSFVFLQWAGALSSQSQELYKNEIMTRRMFNSQITNHFLQTLFPGLEDFPPPFATQDLKPFDDRLPPLVSNDIDVLRDLLPELSDLLILIPLCSMPRPIVMSPLDSYSDAPSHQLAEPSSKSSTRMDSTLEDIKSSQQKDDKESSLNIHQSIGDSELSVDKPCESSKVEDMNSQVSAEKAAESDDEFEDVGEVQKMEGQQEDLKCSKVSEKGESVALTSQLRKQRDVTQESQSSKDMETALTAIPDEGNLHDPVRERIQSPDSCVTTSQDFLTADFYIDESLPSSYTDSNGTTARGNHMVKSHHALVAELQKQLEEKNAALQTIQGELKQTRSHLQRVQVSFSSLQGLTALVHHQIRSEVSGLHNQLIDAQKLVLGEIVNITAKVQVAVEKIQTQTQVEKLRAIEEAISKVQEEQEILNKQCQNELEIEAQKLSDAHREIDLYQQQLQDLSKLVENIRQESETALNELKNKLVREHEEMIKKVTLEHELELESDVEAMKQTRKEHEEEVQDLKERLIEQEKQIQILCRDKQNLEESFTLRVNQEKTELQHFWEHQCLEREQRLQHDLEEKHGEELKRLNMLHEELVNKTKEELQTEFQKEWELKLLDIKKGVMDLSVHEQMVSQMCDQLDQERKRAVRLEEEMNQTLQTERESHRTKIELVQQQCQEQLAVLKDSIEAEHQKLLEEAINQVMQEKEDAILELQKHHELMLQQEKATMQVPMAFEQESDSLSKEVVPQIRQGEIPQAAESKFDISSSVTSMMESTVRLNSAPDSMLELKHQLFSRDQEVAKLQQKLMEVSDASGGIVAPSADKVSILTCNPGDVVLLCYDEGHQNYVLFILGPVLHFLHTECLETLGLKTAPGETRKAWVLAEVVEKEYCQARKPQNRYRVPVGTRFYRVKAKSWDKDAAIKREHQRRAKMALKGMSSMDSAGPSSFGEGPAGGSGTSASS